MAPKRARTAPAKRVKPIISAARVAKKPAANTSAKRHLAKKAASTTPAKDLKHKKSEPKQSAPKSVSRAVPEASTAPSKKTKVESEPVAASRAPKKQKTEEFLNSSPVQKLNIYVFGSGESGELGLGHVARNGKIPTDVKRPRLNDLLDVKLVGVVQMAVGGMHCVALTHDGKILTWGVNDNGALGRDTTWDAPTKDIDAAESDDDSDSDSNGESGLNPKESTPTAIPAEFFNKVHGDLVQVVATDSASFVLTLKVYVYGWGTFSGSDGNIGFSKTVHKDTKPSIQPRPTLLPTVKKITSLASGGNHMLALDSHSAIYAWGCGQQSQLGRPVMDTYRIAALTPSLVRIPRSKTSSSANNQITSIAAGQFHSFALTALGEVYTWGLNNFAQTGIAPKPADGDGQQDASELIVAKPTLVESLAAYTTSDGDGGKEHITALAGGNHHSLALTSAGKVLSWGRCDASQAGMPLSSVPKKHLVFDDRGKARILAHPTPVPNLERENVKFIATGIDNSIAITGAGKVFSWGFSANYRTGFGTEDPVDVPTLVENSAVKGKKIVWAGCGGQFSVLAGVAAENEELAG